MSRTKIILLCMAGALVIRLSWLGYQWHQATQLPAWASEPPPTQVAQQRIVRSDSPLQWTTPTEVELPDDGDRDREPSVPAKKRELRNFHVQMLTRGDPLEAAVSGSRATFEHGKLDAGVILDVSKINYSNMPAPDRRAVSRALDVLGLSGKQIYVGLEDRPLNHKGILQVSDNVEVKIGNTRHSLASVAQKVGLSPAQLRRQINSTLAKSGLRYPSDQ